METNRTKLNENQLRNTALGTKRNVSKRTDNTWVNNSLKIWRKICTLLKFDEDLLAFKEIEWDPDFKPNKTDKTFYLWRQKGLIFLGQFINDDGVVAFKYLSKKYDLPQSHFFHYLQVRTYIGNSQLQSNNQRSTPLVKFMLKNHSMNMIKHQICTIYKILININTPDEKDKRKVEGGIRNWYISRGLEAN